MIAVAAGAFRAAWIVFARPFDARTAARLIEQHDAAWDERLSTVVTQIGLPPTHRGSAAMNATLATAVARETIERPPVRQIPWLALGPAVVGVMAVGLVWAATATSPWMDLPRLAVRQLRPWSDVPPVTGVRIDLQPHAKAIRQGRPLSIDALVTGGGPVTLHVGPDESHLRALDMPHNFGPRYTITLLSLQDDFVYRVTAGDAETGLVAVKVLRTPGVTGFEFVIDYADGQPPLQRPGDDGQLTVRRGARVGVILHTSEPVRTATVRVGDRTIDAKSEADRQTWRARFDVVADTDWSIELLNDRGTRGTGPAGMRFTVDR